MPVAAAERPRQTVIQPPWEVSTERQKSGQLVTAELSVRGALDIEGDEVDLRLVVREVSPWPQSG